MSFGILQTFYSRLQKYGWIRSQTEFQDVLRQFQSHDGVYEQLETTIMEVERPPMISLPEYQQKFGRRP